jgi:hypothetical protein
MKRTVSPWLVGIALVLVLAHAALAATSTAVLAVEGMT